MKILKTAALVLACLFLSEFLLPAQGGNSVKLKLVDESTGEAVSFATVSLQATGAKKPAAYALTSEDGSATLSGFRAGEYALRAELLGYEAIVKELKISGAVDLGVLKMKVDRQQLDAATVSATGNAIIMKKDTIEYNASSFKTTDNDVLEDLLKKLPGVEISEDGSITVNGETVSKITIEGKTFFLDDPQLASKNLPAKMVNKLKVIRKKSEQAEFTGIDDGEEETVIDLGIKPGMMKGAFGNIMAGAGHDLPSTQGTDGDWRYQGAAFVGKFTDKTQISFLLNANNTNNRGFNDLSGNMMGNMRGEGRGMGGGQGGWGRSNGILTSYMGGANGAWDLLGDKMDLSANYLYNYTSRDIEESSFKRTYLQDSDLIYNSAGVSNTTSGGNRFGMRLEHKFSESTSILFEPQLNFGTGSYFQSSNDTTYTDDRAGSVVKLSDAHSNTSGANKNISTSGFFLFRQRLGIPGRTVTAMARYSFSDNDLDGLNENGTRAFAPDGSLSGTSTAVDQRFEAEEKNGSLWSRLTYTEPLGDNLYLEGNYSYSWSRSTSEKQTYNNADGSMDYTYSNEIVNESNTQNIGANLMYQKGSSRAQIGFSAQPNHTYNSTTKYNGVTGKYEPQEYDPGLIWNFSPRAMAWWEFNENANARMFYHGRTAQPSTSKLMPVPDNSNPLDISFGNPGLKPYFSHDLRGELRYSNKQKFSSLNIRINGNYVQDPIVSTVWYGKDGAQYTMPFNGPSSFSFGFNEFGNLPIAKSNFSISNITRFNWSRSASYVGTDIDMSTYDTDGYYKFMEEFVEKFADKTYFDAHIAANTMTNMTIVERLRFTYRSDNLELQVSPRTRMNRSWYTIATTASNTTTWNNQVRGSVNWTVEPAGLAFESELNYNWYRGYSTPQPSEFVMDAEIQKLLFKKKVTLAVKAYDIFGQSKNLSVTDSANLHKESRNNTLGRYIMASLTYRFGTFDRSKMKGMGGPGGPGGRGPGGPR
jgi:hypothetical protein